MSAAALGTVTTGAPGRARSNRSAAEFLRTEPIRARQVVSMSCARFSNAVASATARVQAIENWAIQRLVPSCASFEVAGPR